MARGMVQVIGAKGLGSTPRPVEITLRHADWPGWRFVLRFTLTGTLGDFRIVYDAGRLPTRLQAAEVATGRAVWDPLAEGGPAVTARLLDDVPLGALELEARRHMTESARRSAARGLQTPNYRKNVERIASTMAKRPGRKGRSDLDYAVIAAVYVDCLDRPKPVEATAAFLHLAPDTVSNALHEARSAKRDLLTRPPGRGKAGGDLTPKAIQLLKEMT